MVDLLSLLHRKPLDNINAIKAACVLFGRFIEKLYKEKRKITHTSTSEMLTELGIHEPIGTVRRLGRAFGYGNLALSRCYDTHYYYINDYNLDTITSKLEELGEKELAETISKYAEFIS